MAFRVTRGRFGIPGSASKPSACGWIAGWGNVTFPGGRVLNGAGSTAGVDPRDPDGHARIFGAGPMTLESVEPFRRWKASWH